MIYIDETKSRIAGQVAAADAICEYADKLSARQAAGMLRRVERTAPPTRVAKLRLSRLPSDLSDSLIRSALAPLPSVETGQEDPRILGEPDPTRARPRTNERADERTNERAAILPGELAASAQLPRALFTRVARVTCEG